MIVYLDASSLVKLFIEEDHSDTVRRWVADARVVATSRTAFPEVLSALGRLQRLGSITETALQATKEAFTTVWMDLSRVEIDEHLAGTIVQRHGLRALDAIHVAAALSTQVADWRAELAFSSFDVRQLGAARAEGLRVLEPDMA